MFVHSLSLSDTSLALQKAAQQTTEQLKEMLEVSCLWVWMHPQLKKLLGDGSAMLTLEDAWTMGTLG